ncbi:MAG: molybdopterin-dependent oxidoreductase [Anaerolineae bacterium]|nr:molybdopterin-dependent oxidoreductase [Anaerolineae bacterium]
MDASALQQADALFQDAEHPIVLYGPDVVRGRSAEATAAALRNLELLLGRERVAYLGPDANSQGARDMGVLPTRLPGHAPVGDAQARAALKRLWGGDVPEEPGQTYSQMLRSAAEGELRALYVMGADPASEGRWAAAALDRVKFMVVQDVFLTETARRADVVLPASTYAESDGTFTNMERRVQRAPMAFRPQPGSRPDWEILVDLARRWPAEGGNEPSRRETRKGKRDRRAQSERWVYASARDVLVEITKAVPQYAGLTWDALGEGGQQWPVDSAYDPSRFQMVTPPHISAEGGRSFFLAVERFLYDHGTLMLSAEQFRNMLIEPVARLCPDDLERLGVSDGEMVRISSPYAAVELPVRADQTVRPGVVALAYSLPGAPAEALLGPEGPGITVNVAAVGK